MSVEVEAWEGVGGGEVVVVVVVQVGWERNQRCAL